MYLIVDIFLYINLVLIFCKTETEMDDFSQNTESLEEILIGTCENVADGSLRTIPIISTRLDHSEKNPKTPNNVTEGNKNTASKRSPPQIQTLKFWRKYGLYL